MYDWANSAFATTIMAAMFPPFYRSLVVNAGLTQSTATAYWGYTTALALLLIAVIAPLLGAISDYSGNRKKNLAFFIGIGVAATASFTFIQNTTWVLASILYIIANIGFAGAEVFYESLLPYVAQRGDIDQVSSKGYALGYVGGGVLLLINVLWFIYPDWFLMPDSQFAVYASFLSVAVWWAIFSVPLFRHVPEPPPGRTSVDIMNPVVQGLKRVKSTIREIALYKQVLIFLIAYWIYNDGIGTIIKMATAYGDEIGIEMQHLILALIITQFIGIPFAFLFGALAKKIGAKKSILLALFVYVLISIGGFFMQTALHFYLLAFMVGTVQGGSQALSRSLYGVLIPRHKSAEFYGFYSTSSKFAGIFGPLIFGVVSQLTGESRLSILSLIIFFVVGGALLMLVDVKKGARIAGKTESKII